MKKISTIVAVVMVSLVSAQAYKGKGDIKAQVGMNIQDQGFEEYNNQFVFQIGASFNL